MQGMHITAMIFAMLSLLAIASVVGLQVAKSKAKRLGDLLVLGSCALLFLGALFFAIAAKATWIIGGIFWMIAWPGLAAGYIMNNLATVKAFGQAMAEKAEQAEQAPQPSQDEQNEQNEQDEQKDE